MAATRRGVVLLAALGNTRAQIVGRLRLALAGDVVEFAFYGQQGNIADGRWIYFLTVDLPGAARQPVFLEYYLDGIQIELGRHVQHGVVLIVEASVRFGIVVIALEQIHIEIVVRARDRKSTRLNSSH